MLALDSAGRLGKISIYSQNGVAIFHFTFYMHSADLNWTFSNLTLECVFQFLTKVFVGLEKLLNQYRKSTYSFSCVCDPIYFFVSLTLVRLKWRFRHCFCPLNGWKFTSSRFTTAPRWKIHIPLSRASSSPYRARFMQSLSPGLFWSRGFKGRKMCAYKREKEEDDAPLSCKSDAATAE
jgi:hypothetical protein